MSLIQTEYYSSESARVVSARYILKDTRVSLIQTEYYSSESARVVSVRYILRDTRMSLIQTEYYKRVSSSCICTIHIKRTCWSKAFFKDINICSCKPLCLKSIYV